MAFFLAAYIGIISSGMAVGAVHPHGRASWYGVRPRMMAMAEKVAKCEEGGRWHFRGTTYDGGLGWTLANWQQFRAKGWPRWMHSATPHQQANALFRFVWHYRIPFPDQQYCAGY